MDHTWEVISRDDYGPCAWICHTCGQLAQVRPDVKVATLKCGEYRWVEYK